MRFTRGIGWVGAVLALAAAALFTRFSFDDTMRRDEAIYAYGGQQLAAGVPLYRGIFDPRRRWRRRWRVRRPLWRPTAGSRRAGRWRAVVGVAALVAVFGFSRQASST
jgi:hypothetical protein